MENQVKNKISPSKLVCNILAVINELHKKEVVESSFKKALKTPKH